MERLVQLGADIAKLWEQYGDDYLNGIQNTLILALVVFIAMRYTPLKKLHPILFIAFSAVVGVVLQF